MRLVCLRVQNYKSIEDSGEFSVGALTCLAGKNEAGKTALLQAIRRLNPVETDDGDFDSLMEYPRRRHPRFATESKAVLTTKWELDEKEIGSLSHLVGPNSINSPVITVTRGYENETNVAVDMDAKAIVEFLVSAVPELTDRSRGQAIALSDPEALIQHLESLDRRTKGEKTLLKRAQATFPTGGHCCAVSDFVLGRLPLFLYFSTYDALPGRVALEQFVRRIQRKTENEQDRLFEAFLELASVAIKDLQSAQRSEELISKLESVSNYITDQIFEYWSQNKYLRVQLRYDAARPSDPPPFDSGNIVSLRVENQRHRVSVGFDERSAGFVWFFSFLVWFSQVSKHHDRDLIILLDEPGLSLHGKAQADLLRYIKEKLLPKHQVIYTTHSPFMIDVDDILNVRTVEDVTPKAGRIVGTRVGDRALSADADTLFPLRAAIGYDITQSLFVGKHCLLVEGPSDLLYLRWASRQLDTRRESGLDPRWTITPVGGIDKLGSFMALFAGNDLHVAVLTDLRRGGKNAVARIRDSQILRAGHLFTVDEFTETEEADIEDMLGWPLYAAILNRRYALKERHRLPDQQPGDGPEGVLETAKRHFALVATEGPEFDHLSPAVYLVEHETEFAEFESIDTILGRFGRFFAVVNALLPRRDGQ